MAETISHEYANLLRQVAHHGSGVQTLRRAILECAAVSLHLHPFVVDATRTYLDALDGWNELERALEALDDAEKVGAEAREQLLEGESDEARSLINRAMAHSRGASFLEEGDPLEVAETFGVHPYVVFRARGTLERKSVAPGRS